MKVILAGDHGGFELKSRLKCYLESIGYETHDFGPFERNPGDDYSDFVIPAMKYLQKNENSKAILICKNGVGVSILANKFKGVRAALSWTPEHAESARTDDDTNVLALPAKYISPEEAQVIAERWLSTKFNNQERYIRRLDKMSMTESRENHYDSTGNF